MKGSPAISDLLENDYPNELQVVVGIMSGLIKKAPLKKFCERYDCSKFNLSAEDVKIIEKLDKNIEKINNLLLAEEIDENKLIGLCLEFAEICGMSKGRIREIGLVLQSVRTQKAS